MFKIFFNWENKMSRLGMRFEKSTKFYVAKSFRMFKGSLFLRFCEIKHYYCPLMVLYYKLSNSCIILHSKLFWKEEFQNPKSRRAKLNSLIRIWGGEKVPRAIGLVVWFLLWVQEVPGSIPGSPLFCSTSSLHPIQPNTTQKHLFYIFQIHFKLILFYQMNL